MTRLHFTANAFGPATTAEVPVGERVMDACDAVEAAVPFSCRDARCGTCLVEVFSGAELLAPPGAEERLVLDALGRPAGPEDGRVRYRLACQALVAAAGEVQLKLATPATS